MAEEANTNIETGQTSPADPETEVSSGFKPIESQEALDAIIKDRLSRKEASVRKEYEGYMKPEDYQSSLNELNEAKTKLRDYETASEKKDIARKYGLPEEMAGRLAGRTAKEWRADAESLSRFFKPSYPSRSNINVDASDGDEMKDLLRQLRGA